MVFTLREVVPWGRSFDEYVAMFSLTPADLTKRILGCGDGPASFNAVLTEQGGSVTSVDPLYAFSAAEIRDRIAEVTPAVLEQTSEHADAFVWRHVASVDDLAGVRRAAMDRFLRDYGNLLPRDVAAEPSRGSALATAKRPRYIDAALPALPFADGEFDLALCSHLLFLYSEQHALEFHLESLTELCRVAREVRVFPLLELSGVESRHLDLAVCELAACGHDVSRHRVAYEFQRGGNEMLVVRGHPQ